MSDSIHPDITSSSQPEASAAAVERQPDQPTESSQAPEEWETVTFPGAIDIDALPVAMPEEHGADTVSSLHVFEDEPPMEGQEGGDRETLISQLQTENATLRSQIFTLEQDLSQLQIELQLEVTRFYCKEAEASEFTLERDRLTCDLEAAQTQIRQLAADLKQSQDTIQTQQTELETLHLQLTQSHHRIAQLERDCALSQQRYNEQLQLVSQAETACQDLRMRLHRQQQQTLQFKAALEKSIEMNAALETLQTADTNVHPTPEPQPSQDNVTPFLLKARPVQPWSVAPGQHNTATPKRASGLPDLLAQLAQPVTETEPEATAAATPDDQSRSATAPEAIAPPTEPTPHKPPLDQASQNVLAFLFPTAASPEPAAVPSAEAAVFDLSPFVEAGEVDAEVISANPAESTVEPVVHHPAPLRDRQPDNEPPKGGLWADLARLIEPELAQSAPETTTTAETADVEATPIVEKLPRSPAPTAPEPPVSFRNPFPSFTLRPLTTAATSDVPEETAAFDAGTPIAIAAESATPEKWETAPTTGFPSPTLYPSRPTKKRASMAAVELPSFPRG